MFDEHVLQYYAREAVMRTITMANYGPRPPKYRKTERAAYEVDNFRAFDALTLLRELAGVRQYTLYQQAMQWETTDA